MKRKIKSVITAICHEPAHTRTLVFMFVLTLALALAGCSNDGKDSGRGNSSGNKTSLSENKDGKETTSSKKHENSSGTGSQSGTEKTDNTEKQDSTEKTEGTETSAAAGNDNDPVRSDRHFYKTVVFYGSLNSMYLDTSPTALDGAIYPYNGSAFVLDYDTATGKITRARMCMYYCGWNEESYEDWEEREKRSLYKTLDNAGNLIQYPYTIETFYIGYNDKINVLIFELSEDFDINGFDVYLTQYFLNRHPKATPQNIDGLIYDVLYDNFDYQVEKPYPYFGDNFFWWSSPYIDYTVAWYDNGWDIKTPDPAADYRGQYPDKSMPWSPEDYGSTSYNTGGGYTGSYRYEDGLK